MDKIIGLICEEARRRPGKRLVPKLYQVLLEVQGKVGNLLEELLAVERKGGPNNPPQKGVVNDTQLKRS